jgi:short-chain fatty acids transporter
MRPKKESDYVVGSEALIADIEAQNKIGTEKTAGTTPIEKIDNAPILSLVIGALGLTALIVTGAFKRLDFNNFNFLMLTRGILLCGSPNNFIKGVQNAVGATWGIIIQFPFYAGMFGLIAYTGLNDVIVKAFMSFATTQNWYFSSYIYTVLVNFAIPSGGPKFTVVAPYLLDVASRVNADAGVILLAYTAGDCAMDGFLPFWALPYLAMFRLEFKHILPYTVIGSFIAFLVFGAFFLFAY